jgi:hypothetical protein
VRGAKAVTGARRPSLEGVIRSGAVSASLCAAPTRYMARCCPWEMALKRFGIVRCGVVTGMSVLLLAACVSSRPSSPASSPPHSGTTGSHTAGSTGSPDPQTSGPPIEATTGLESPQAPGDGGGANAVAISVVPLPAGKAGNSGDNDECIQVSWLGQPIPHGDVVTVSAVAVQQPFTFDQEVTAHCEGGPSCAGYQFSAANDNGDAFCNVGLGYTDGTIDQNGDDSLNGSMQLTGHLRCPDAGSAACHQDADAMQSSGIGSIKFEVSVISRGSPSSGTSSSDNPGSSSSAPDGGSSGPGSGSSAPTAASSS